MKKLMDKLKFKPPISVSELSAWTAVCGLCCILSLLLCSTLIFGFSPYIATALIKLSLRMVAQTVLIAAIVDLLCKNVPEDD